MMTRAIDRCVPFVEFRTPQSLVDEPEREKCGYGREEELQGLEGVRLETPGPVGGRVGSRCTEGTRFRGRRKEEKKKRRKEEKADLFLRNYTPS